MGTTSTDGIRDMTCPLTYELHSPLLKWMPMITFSSRPVSVASLFSMAKNSSLSTANCPHTSIDLAASRQLLGKCHGLLHPSYPMPDFIESRNQLIQEIKFETDSFCFSLKKLGSVLNQCRLLGISVDAAEEFWSRIKEPVGVKEG